MTLNHDLPDAKCEEASTLVRDTSASFKEAHLDNFRESRPCFCQ